MRFRAFLLILLVSLVLTVAGLIIQHRRAGRQANNGFSASSGYVWRVKRVVNRHKLIVVDQFNSTFSLTVEDTRSFKKGDKLTGK